MAVVVVAPKVVAVKVVVQLEVAVAKGTAVDGQVEREIHQVEGVVMHLQLVAKNRF